jgi:hypothetical protein
VLDLVCRYGDVVVGESVQGGEHVGEHCGVESGVLVVRPLEQAVAAESGGEVVGVGEVASFGSGEEGESLAGCEVVVGKGFAQVLCVEASAREVSRGRSRRPGSRRGRRGAVVRTGVGRLPAVVQPWSCAACSKLVAACWMDAVSLWTAKKSMSLVC